MVKNRTVLNSVAGVSRWMADLGFRIPGQGRPVLRLVFGVLFLPPAALYLWLLFLPWPIYLRWWNPTTTSFMEYRLKEAERLGDTLELRQEWVPLTGISRNLRRTVLTAEDDRFYQHRGIDWEALAEEVEYPGDTSFSWFSSSDLRALGTSVAHAWADRHEIKGRSTLTQQLAKNLYFTPRRSFFRKLSEAVVAKRLEACLSKDRILELYLNVAEWGPGVFGAQAAAESYFGRGAGDLRLDQAAALAATLPQPLSSNPSYRPSRMEWRKALILTRLRGPPPPQDTTAAGGEGSIELRGPGL